MFRLDENNIVDKIVVKKLFGNEKKEGKLLLWTIIIWLKFDAFTNISYLYKYFIAFIWVN